MCRGKEELERKLDTVDTRYYQEQIKAGNEDEETTLQELKKKEKKSLAEKIHGIFKSKKSEEEKEKEIREVTTNA